MARIKNWSKFQHFKDRRPPWIKLYRDILDDREWHKLDGESAKLLTMLWLLASEGDGEIPSVEDIAFRVRMDEAKVREALPKLSHWLEQCDISAISGRYQDDAPETERETEVDAEEEVETEGRGRVLAPAVADAPRKKPAKTSPELQAACKATWDAYSKAYFDSHGTEPVRNAKVSAQVVQLVKRLGATESPQVAAWFVGHRDAFYVRKLHDFGLLLQDAEKLRTEWATGTAMTQTRARQADRAGAMAGAVGEILNERRAVA